MADLQALLDAFARRFEAGEDPDPAELLEQVDGDERQELGSMLDSYLMTAPRRAWDPVAYESSLAKQAVDRVFESLEGVSGEWPELLPTLRNRARIKRSELVQRLTEALGLGEAKREKVAGYYNDMEHGQLPAEGVDGKVIDALAGILGASAEVIRRAGTRRAALGGEAEVAYARMSIPDPEIVLESDYEVASSAAAERDEVDRLFTGG